MKHFLKKTLTSLTGYWFYKETDLPVGTDLFVDLRRLGKNQFEVVFDIGGNIGQTIKKYAPFFDRATVYSFEPVPHTFTRLIATAKKYPNVECFNIGFGAEKKKETIYINPNSSLMSSLKKITENLNEREETISLNTLDHFVTEQNLNTIDFLKIDVEGYELEVLKGAHNLLAQSKIKLILCEVKLAPEGFGYERHNSLADCLHFMSQFDFVLYGIYNIWAPGIKTASHFADALFIHKNHRLSL